MALLLHRMAHPDLILTTASNMLCVFSFLLWSAAKILACLILVSSIPSIPFCVHTQVKIVPTLKSAQMITLCSLRQTSLKLFHNYPRISFFPPSLFLMGFLFDLTLPRQPRCPDSVCCFCDQSDVTSSAPVPLCLKLLLLWFGQFVQSVVGEAFKKFSNGRISIYC